MKKRAVQPLFGAKRRLWTNGQVREAAMRIDAYNRKAENLIQAIREGHHPQGEEIAEALEDLTVLASASDIVNDLLRPDSED